MMAVHSVLMKTWFWWHFFMGGGCINIYRSITLQHPINVRATSLSLCFFQNWSTVNCQINSQLWQMTNTDCFSLFIEVQPGAASPEMYANSVSPCNYSFTGWRRSRSQARHFADSLLQSRTQHRTTRRWALSRRPVLQRERSVWEAEVRQRSACVGWWCWMLRRNIEKLRACTGSCSATNNKRQSLCKTSVEEWKSKNKTDKGVSQNGVPKWHAKFVLWNIHIMPTCKIIQL